MNTRLFSQLRSQRLERRGAAQHLRRDLRAGLVETQKSQIDRFL